MVELKSPAQLDWFRRADIKEKAESLKWLTPLRDSVERIINFGCWNWKGSEPFALLWTLDATEITIVEKEQNHLKPFMTLLDWVQKHLSNSIEGRDIQIKIADMTAPIEGLPESYFDLAYCQDVLYQIGEDSEALQNAINEMARVTKPQGFVVAVEQKFRDEFNEPKDMSQFFIATGLTRALLDGAPPYSYIYQKQ